LFEFFPQSAEEKIWRFKMDKEEAKKLISAQGGRVFCVTFTKKDGTERRMLCRRQVKKGVKGVGMAYNPADYDLVTVFDMEKAAYRTINLNTITRICAAGEVHV
jgi:hypothetical protein